MLQSKSCTLVQLLVNAATVSNQPITQRQLDSIRHVGILKFKSSIRMRKKADLSDFERSMVVGARRAGLSISKTADLLRYLHTTTSQGMVYIR